MRIDQPTRLLPWIVAMAGAAWLFSERMSWWSTPMATAAAVAAGAGALIGLINAALAAKGYVRTARAFKYGLLIAAVLVVVRQHGQYLGDALSLADACLVYGGPLALAAYALLGPDARTPWALGAGLIALINWYCEPMLPLLLLGFVVGRDLRSREAASVRHALSLMGAGALAMVLVTAFDFDIEVLLVDRFRPDTPMFSSHVDGGLTFVPRVAVEGALIIACLAHLRGRTWGLLALGALAPVLIVLTQITPVLPCASTGCIGWGHPLRDGGDVVLASTALLAVLPWFGPVVRALCARPGRPPFPTGADC